MIRQSLLRSNPRRNQIKQASAAHVSLSSQYSIVKDQTSQTQRQGPQLDRLRARSSVAHAALYDFSNKAEPQRRQRRAALVGEAYIGRTQFDCQRGICKFCEFLCRPRKPRPSYDGKALIYKLYRLSCTAPISLESLRFHGFSRACRQNFFSSCDGRPVRSSEGPQRPVEAPLGRGQNRPYSSSASRLSRKRRSADWRARASARR